MTIFGVPVHVFGAPFKQVWKRIVMNIVIGFVVALFFLPSFHYNFDTYYKLAFMFGIHDISQAFLHILIAHKLREKYNWITHTKQRVWYGIVLHTIATFAAYFTVPPLYMFLVFGLPFEDSFQTLIGIWPLPIGMVAFVMILAFAGEFFTNWKKSLAAEEKLRARMMSYKYESLRNQINPHFLLDSFAALKKLVYVDRQQAVDFIQQISNLYRRVLEVKDKEFVPLRDELQFLEPYLSLLKLRYGDQLTLTMDVAAEEDELIVPLVLQSLIEHAVENNIQSAEDVLHVHVKKIDDHVEVSNSQQQRKEKVLLDHAGLRNIEQQYEFYSKRPVQYIETTGLFSVRIPVLKQAI